MININFNSLLELVKKPIDFVIDIREVIVGVFELYTEFCDLFPQPFDLLIKILIPTIILMLIVKVGGMIL